MRASIIIGLVAAIAVALAARMRPRTDLVRVVTSRSDAVRADAANDLTGGSVTGTTVDEQRELDQRSALLDDREAGDPLVGL